VHHGALFSILIIFAIKEMLDHQMDIKNESYNEE